VSSWCSVVVSGAGELLCQSISLLNSALIAAKMVLS
jgi:hypothetical protein